MNETVKIDRKISRRNVLLLNSVIERGLKVKDAEEKSPNLLDAVPKETLHELSAFSEECLRKAGLIELSEKLSILKDTK